MIRHFARWGFALLLAWALSLGAGAAAEPTVRAPYRFDYGGWYTVSVMVDGKGPYDFIIDTGATHSLVFRNLADAANFPPSGGPPQRVLGVSSSALLPTYRIGDITLGAASLKNALCVILPDWTVRERSPQGVLGLDFLAKYRVVFDASRHEMLLYSAAAPFDEAVAKWSSAELTADDFGQGFGDLYTVDGVFDRKRARLLIDLGAAGTIINAQAAGKVTMTYQFGLSLNPRGGATRLGRITDAHDDETTVRAVLVDRVRIGRRVWLKRVFLVHEAEIFTELGVEDQPFGLLGTDLLHDRSFALDFPGRRLLFGPRASDQS